MDNYICIGGKKAPLTDEQMRQLGIEPPKVDPFDVSNGDGFFYIDPTGGVSASQHMNFGVDTKRVNIANACKDRKLMEQRAMHETLSRLLWRFAMQNGGIPADDAGYAFIRKVSGCIRPDTYACGSMAGVRFASPETAQRAIDEIVNPFLAEHPDFVW